MNLVDELHAVAKVEVDLPEGTLWVVPRSVLLSMKRLAGRNQDLADLEKLGQDDV